jgi:glycerophosphoryl diester phosphodiesterase
MKMNKIWMPAVLAGMMACTPTAKNNSENRSGLDTQAHRGGRGLMPENTIPAMKNAIDLGVTTLEMDAVISADRQVVVSHDLYFHPNITTTPDGKTINKEEAGKLVLFTMPYDSIKKYDVGLKPHPDFPRQKKMAVHKPLLRELLDSSEAYADTKGRKMNYNIEIKSNPAYDGKKHPPVEEFVDLVVSVIKSKGIEKRVTMQSFDDRALQVVHRKYPDMITSLLIEGNDKRSFEEQIAQLGFTPGAYSPHYSLVNAELVKKCRERNIKLVPWTVNSIEEIQKLKDLGVDAIISDYPDLFEKL